MTIAINKISCEVREVEICKCCVSLPIRDNMGQDAANSVLDHFILTVRSK